MPTPSALLATMPPTSSSIVSAGGSPRESAGSGVPSVDKPPLMRIPTELAQPGLKDMAIVNPCEPTPISQMSIIQLQSHLEQQPDKLSTVTQMTLIQPVVVLEMDSLPEQPQAQPDMMRITSMSFIEPEPGAAVGAGAGATKKEEAPSPMSNPIKPAHPHPLNHHPYSPAMRGAPKIQCVLCGGTLFEWWECTPCIYRVCIHCSPIATKGMACNLHKEVPAIHSCNSCHLPICAACSTHHDYDSSTRICLKCRAEDRCCVGCGILCCCGAFCGIAGHKTVTG